MNQDKWNGRSETSRTIPGRLQNVLGLPVTRGAGFEGHGERSRRAVSRTLGMGLDQKAIYRLRQWRFEPAVRERQPVAVVVNIEVNIRLY
jgi:hypothetical protein